MAIKPKNLNESNEGYGHKSDQFSWRDGPLAWLARIVDYYDNGGYSQVVNEGKELVRIGVKTISDMPKMNEAYLMALFFMGKSYKAMGQIDDATACFHIVYSQSGFERHMLNKPHDFSRFVRLAGEELENIARMQGEDYVSNFQIELFFSKVLGKKGGCFIATAVYDSPFAPEVLILRQFRDEVLLNSIWGKLLVNLYYFASPPLASAVSKNHLLKAATRCLLLEPVLLSIKRIIRL